MDLKRHKVPMAELFDDSEIFPLASPQEFSFVLPRASIRATEPTARHDQQSQRAAPSHSAEHHSPFHAKQPWPHSSGVDSAASSSNPRPEHAFEDAAFAHQRTRLTREALQTFNESLISPRHHRSTNEVRHSRRQHPYATKQSSHKPAEPSLMAHSDLSDGFTSILPQIKGCVIQSECSN